MWTFRRHPRPPAPPGLRPAARLRLEPLEDRTAPANLRMTGAITVDAFNVAQPNPVFGQMVYVRATWASEALVGGEACPVRYTVNGIPLDTGTFAHAAGSWENWSYHLGGWYAGTAAFSVTVTVDPTNVVAETNEADNSLTFTVTPVAPADLPAKFLQPIGLTPNKDWTIYNYADVDPRAGFRADYRGGPYQVDGHFGIDTGPVNFARQDAGAPLLAAADGTVIEAVDGSFDRETTLGSWPGNYVRIAHGNNWETWYYHFAADSITVRVGDRVKAGQVIGLMGSSGNSTGTHLHYHALYRGCPVELGISPSSYWVDPLPYVGDVPAFSLDAGVTNYDWTFDFYEKPSQLDRFGTADTWTRTLNFYVHTYNLKPTDVLSWSWLRPNGTVEHTASYSPPQKYVSGVWDWPRPLSAFQVTTGTWHVVYNLNGVEQRRVPFEIIPGAGPASARFADATGRILLDGRTTPVDFGTVPLAGGPAEQSFTVWNHGNDTLILAGYDLPPGFTLVAGPGTVPVGGTGTVTVRLDAAVAGSKFDTLRIATNDPDVGVYELILSGVVSGPPPAGAPAVDLDGSAAVLINPATAFNFRSLPRLLSPAATVTDLNSPTFAGGTLRVEFASFGAAEDRLAVRNQGTAAGQVGVSGSAVTYGGAAARPASSRPGATRAGSGRSR